MNGSAKAGEILSAHRRTYYTSGTCDQRAPNRPHPRSGDPRLDPRVPQNTPQEPGCAPQKTSVTHTHTAHRQLSPAYSDTTSHHPTGRFTPRHKWRPRYPRAMCLSSRVISPTLSPGRSSRPLIPIKSHLTMTVTRKNLLRKISACERYAAPAHSLKRYESEYWVRSVPVRALHKAA